MWPFKKRSATVPTQIAGTGIFGANTLPGVHVSENSVMGIAAHFACVRLIATTLASLPVHVYERTAAGKKKRNDHDIARLLRETPNPEMTAASFIEAMQAQVSNRGSAFAEIVYDRQGNVKELWPIAPGVCQPQRDKKTGKIVYKLSGTGEVLPAFKILHIPGLSFDGVNSLSPVQLFRQTFGLGMAVEEFGVRFFSNGTNIGGFIEFPGSVKKDALDRIKTSINENYSGLRKSHGIMILEEGAKFEKLGMPLEDAQFIESRKFTATEIARIHGVPPHMIGDLERATFSNVEEQGLDAVRYLFRPWAVRWEQALNIKLFGETDRERFYVKFELDGLMRGNMKARYDAYSVGLQQGILCVDEARGFEDLPPLPNGEGKIHRFPLNLGEAGKGVKSEN